eukprot:Clim_evm58s218 gene=Clim_evmTU58s218
MIRLCRPSITPVSCITQAQIGQLSLHFKKTTPKILDFLGQRHICTSFGVRSTSGQNNDASSSTGRLLRLAYFGSDDFSVAHLEDLCRRRRTKKSSSAGTSRRNAAVVADITVICPAPRPQGRKKVLKPTAVQEFAEQNGLQVKLISRDTPVEDMVKAVTPMEGEKPYDIGIAVSFGYFIPSDALRQFTLCALNVHPSLLPRYRGSSPMEYCILYGDKKTGITIQELSPRKFDAGKILAQESFTIGRDWDYAKLMASALKKGPNVLMRTLDNLDKYMAEAWSQDESGILMAPRVTSRDAVLPVDRRDDEWILRHARALSSRLKLRLVPWNSGVLADKEAPEFKELREKGELLVFDIQAANKVDKEHLVLRYHAPLCAANTDGDLFVKCGRVPSDSYVRISEVQLPAANSRISGRHFLKRYGGSSVAKHGDGWVTSDDLWFTVPIENEEQRGDNAYYFGMVNKNRMPELTDSFKPPNAKYTEKDHLITFQ